MQMPEPQTQIVCPFCDIENGAGSVRWIKRARDFIAFRDHKPVARTHILVASRRHVATLRQLPTNEQTALFASALALARELELREFRVIANVGRGGGQRVMHAHIHIIAPA